jgi:CRP-like cAMP-binding protein
LHVAGPGETLAEASLFSPQYHCDAIANIDATVRVYPKREVLTAFEEHPKAARAFTETLAHQVMNSAPVLSNVTFVRHASAFAISSRSTSAPTAARSNCAEH